MSGPNTEYVNITNTRLHGAWMWHKSAETQKWNPVWSVLRDNVLFFFTSENTCLENHVGTLHLNKDCSFHYGDGSPKDGYKFELQIAKKKKKFKVKTVYERELWRAYMEGVITGTVPQDVAMSPQDTQEITNKLRCVRYGSPPDMQSSGPARPPVHSQSTPAFGPHTRDADSLSGSPACAVPRATPQRRPSLPFLTSTTTGSSSSGGEFDPPGNDSLHDLSIHSRDSGRSSDYFDGGPFMRHRFTTEGDGNPPPWFFHNCSRELAEKILTQCHHMGNTLMRVSWTARNTGSYAISKRMEWSGNISHYEVVRVAEGYRINVENCNKALKTLSDVMDFFIQLSGPTTTHPMSNNDLQQLGIDYTDYSRRIVKLPEDVPPVPSPIDIDSDEGDNYEIPREPPGKLLPSAPPAPVAPPGPAPHASLAPGSSGLKPASSTWGRDKREAATRQTHTQGGGVAKTLGPSGSDWRSGRADSVKPSAMSVNQTMQERDVVENLDAVLRREEKSSALRGSATPSDIPPPLPPVPESRPKLDAQGNPIYENQRKARGVSQVPATASPPSVVRPSDVGGKMPPLTFPKTPSVHHLSISEENKDTVMDRAKAASRVNFAMPGRRISLPLCRLRRLHQRWSSRRSTVPLPLVPDYSSEENSSDSSDCNNNSSESEACIADTCTDAITDESRKRSSRTGAKRLGSTRAGLGETGSLRRPEPEPGAGLREEGEGPGEARLAEKEVPDSLSYSEIMIQPEVGESEEEAKLRLNVSGHAGRPDSTTYSEIILGPRRKELNDTGPELVELGTEEKGEWRKEAGLQPEGADRKGVEADADDRETEDVYYIELLGEDEVIFDLMYASGQGSIQFWRPQGTLSHSAMPGHTPSADESGPGMSVMQELQQKLQLGNALKRVTPRAGPAAVQLPSRADSRQQQPAADGQQEGEMYEDTGQYYQNCP